MLMFVGLGVALGFGVCGLNFGISVVGLLGCWVVGFLGFGFEVLKKWISGILPELYLQMEEAAT